MAMRRLGLLLIAFVGCNTPTYLKQRRPLETRADPAGGYATDTDLYVLPVRRPTDDEQRARDEEQRTRMLMQDVPWAGTRDFSVEIEWSIKNLEGRTVEAFLAVNGGNEFGDYVPLNYVDPNADEDDQVEPPPLLGGSPIVLSANQTRLAVFREDQIAEASLDLEAITRYPSGGDALATPFVVIAHDSSASKNGLDGLPAQNVTPVMVRYQFVLSADGHVVVDYTVRVRTDGDKLAEPGANSLYVSRAAALPPPIPAPFAMMTTP